MRVVEDKDTDWVWRVLSKLYSLLQNSLVSVEGDASTDARPF